MDCECEAVSFGQRTPWLNCTDVTYRLCTKRFENSQFMNEKQNALTWNAVPTPTFLMLWTGNALGVSLLGTRLILMPVQHIESSAMMMWVTLLLLLLLLHKFKMMTSYKQERARCQAHSLQIITVRLCLVTRREKSSWNIPSVISARLSRAKQRVTSTAPSASSVKGLNVGRRLPAKRHAALLHALSDLERLLPSATYNFKRGQMSLVQKQGRRWSPKRQVICHVHLLSEQEGIQVAAGFFKYFYSAVAKHTATRPAEMQYWTGFSGSIIDTLAVKVKRMSEQEKQFLTKWLWKQSLYKTETETALTAVRILVCYHCDYVLMFLLRGVSIKMEANS